MLARARLARRPGRVALVGVGVVSASAVLAAVLAGSLIAQDRGLARSVADIPPPNRALRLAWFGVPGSETAAGLDRTAMRALAAATDRPPARFVLFRQSTIAGSFVALGAVDGLERWVRLRSGRFPATCRPERCEVVELRGGGRIPNAPGLRLVKVGVGTLRSTTLFGDFITPVSAGRDRGVLAPKIAQGGSSFHQPPPPPLVLAEGVEGLARSPRLGTVYRSYGWVVPLAADSVHPWDVETLARQLERTRSVLEARSPAFDLTAPVQELQAGADLSRTAGRRLLLLGGEAAALLFAFAVLAAASMRRDVEAAWRRLTWAGARRWQLASLTAVEAAAVAALAAVLGWAAGAAIAAALASAAGSPTRALLVHSVLAPSGLATAALVVLAAALVVLGTVRARPLEVVGLGLSALDVTALAAVGAVVLALTRGEADPSELTSGRGTGVFLLLLPGLITFAAAVVCARVLGPALRLLERRGRGRLAVRLAVLSLARRPGYAAVAAAFLVVSLGLALFAETYRATLERGERDEAAFAVPLDFTLKEDLGVLTPVRDVATPSRLHGLGSDVRPARVLRLTGNVTRAVGIGGVDVLGLPPRILPALDGWRSDFASEPPRSLARRITPSGTTRLRGLRLPLAASALHVRMRGERRIGLTAEIESPGGDFAHIELGPDGTAAIPAAARGGLLVGFAVTPPPRLVARGQDAGTAFRGTVELGPVRTRAGSGWHVLGPLRGWIGTNGVRPRIQGTRAVVAFELTNDVVSRLRPGQPTDGKSVPAIASSRLAALADVHGRLPIELQGETVVLRVVATARHFPTAGADFLVADSDLLATAVNADAPGAAIPNEVWLDTSPGGRAPVGRILARPPFAALEVTSRAEIERDLGSRPLARGSLLALGAAAGIAVALALLGLLLVVVSDLRDERGELFALEAQGAEPGLLQAQIRIRAVVVAAFGLLGGAVTGAILSAIVVALVTVTAAAEQPEPPLVVAVDWPLVGMTVAGYAAISALLVTVATWSAFRAPVPEQPAEVLA